MSTLLEKEFVLKKGSPVKYYLTDEGEALAKQLYENSRQFAPQIPQETSFSDPFERPALAAAADSVFQFWYLSTERTRVYEKEAAEVKIDTEREL